MPFTRKLNAVYELAGLLAWLSLMPSHSFQNSGAVFNLEVNFQPYSYGDSAGLTPASLLTPQLRRPNRERSYRVRGKEFSICLKIWTFPKAAASTIAFFVGIKFIFSSIFKASYFRASLRALFKALLASLSLGLIIIKRRSDFLEPQASFKN